MAMDVLPVPLPQSSLPCPIYLDKISNRYITLNFVKYLSICKPLNFTFYIIT
ncbi:hypothetical protein HanOQP8_Chr05g0176071 [Helianthus annuus]|nr:hypothetical protein HanOQP8_Chr05g0176071 [Helianthus annuus]KAJ0749310.1 hypothetical protein HanLR1_Chr05g0168371 [Helianthus annuus]